MSDNPAPEMVTLTINGKQVTAPKGKLVIDVAEEAGAHIPRFCYHPRMKPVGMCRMCVVDIDSGRGPALQPSCMIECGDGMVVDTESPGTKKAQDGILEFLLANHPLDCPVCDKGGECPLQDNAYAFGPGESRFVEEKRHYEKPIALSDLVLMDRERCILCDRCTRFAKDVAGDPLIHFINRGSNTEVNTFPDDPFSSYFSGNTVQICPVGALTAKPYRFKARPWDLEEVNSTCTSCSMGCSISIESSRNHVLRYQGVDSDAVNWGWMCDRGRFGFEAIESPERLAGPAVRQGDQLVHVAWHEALDAAARALSSASSPQAIAVVGGARLTNEAAYSWAKLAKGVLGTDNVDAQLADGLPAEAILGLPTATINEVCKAGGTVVLIAPDLKEELSVLYLRLRDAVVHHGAKVVELTTVTTSTSSLATVSLRHRPGEVALAAQALVGGDAAGIIDGDLEAARALIGAGPVTVVLGRPSVAETAAGPVAAADALLSAKPDTRFLVALRRSNVRGAIDMGLAPNLLPGRVTLDSGRDWFTAQWGSVPAAPGLDTTGIFEAAAAGKLDVLVLLGADPLSDFPDHDLARRAIAGARTVIAVDTLVNSSLRQADVVLAAAGFAETSGSTTNVEGRVSLLRQKVTPPGTAREDWVIAAELAHRLGADLGIESPTEIWDEIESVSAAHEGLTSSILHAEVAADGVVVPFDPASLPGFEVSVSIGGAAADGDVADEAAGTDGAVAPEVESEVAEGGEIVPADGESVAAAAQSAAAPTRPAVVAYQAPPAAPVPAKDAYAVRLVATRKLYDEGTLTSHSPSLAGLAPGARVRAHRGDLARLGIPDGGRVRLVSPKGSLVVDTVVDPGVPAGTIALTIHQPGTGNVMELIDSSAPVTEIRMETV